MKEAKDTGLVPEPLFDAIGKPTIATYVQCNEFNYSKFTDLAFTATDVDLKNLPLLKGAIASSDPIERYWGAVGLRFFGEKAAAEAVSLLPLLKDKHAGIRTAAAQALFAMGKKDIAAEALISDVASEMDTLSLLNLLNTLRRLDLLERLPENWAKGKRMVVDGQDYIQQFNRRTKH